MESAKITPSLHFAGSAITEGGEKLFSNISLEFPAGRWSCLLGASGAGKSTILRLLASLDSPVIFDGDITASDGASLAGRVAYMTQSDLLFPWRTVLDNVCLGASLRGDKADKARALDILARVDLGGMEKRKPHQLSGGQRQRVSLARTLMENRPLVLLDEPFSALDAKTRAQMQSLAYEMLQGCTVILVTHDLAEAARTGERIYVIGRENPLAVQGVKGFPSSRTLPPLDDPDTLACQGMLYNYLMGKR